MRFEEKDDGEYRIHAGSMELRAGHGFLATVIVSRRVGGNPAKHEVHRDVSISGGHAWLTSDLALREAFVQGDHAVKADRLRRFSG